MMSRQDVWPIGRLVLGIGLRIGHRNRREPQCMRWKRREQNVGHEQWQCRKDRRKQRMRATIVADDMVWHMSTEEQKHGSEWNRDVVVGGSG